MTPTWVHLICYWLFQLPLGYSLSAVIGLALFRRGRWKSREV